MTIFTASPGTEPIRHRHVRATRIAGWALRGVLSVQFLIGGVLKLIADPTMLAMFTDIGAGQWLRLTVGICEVAGAVGLLVPRMARVAATGLVGLLIGAVTTNVIVLQTSPAVPLVLLALAAVVVVTTRAGREGTR